MSGVDIFDQYCSYYMPDHRSYRKYFRITIHILEMMLVNSYILYRETLKAKSMKYIQMYEYRKKVIRYMV
jgi:hypothetical protein